MLVPWPHRSEPSPLFPASRGYPAASAGATKWRHPPPTRSSTSRRRGRASRPTRSSRSRWCGSTPTGAELDRFASLVRPAGPIPAECDRSARDRRRRRSRGAPRFAELAVRASRAARRSRLRRAQRGLRPAARAARVRTGGRPLPPSRRRVHARRVSAARADASGATGSSRSASATESSLDDAHDARGDALATVGLFRLLLAEGIAPETVELDDRAYMRARSRGDTRPASEPQIRRVFALAREAGIVGADGAVDRDAVAALAVRVARRGDRRAEPRAGAGRLRRARADALGAPGGARGRARSLTRCASSSSRATSPRRTSTRSSTPRTRRSSVAAGSTARSTGRAAPRFWRRAARFVSHATRTGCRPETPWLRPRAGSRPLGDPHRRAGLERARRPQRDAPLVLHALDRDRRRARGGDRRLSARLVGRLRLAVRRRGPAGAHRAPRRRDGGRRGPARPLRARGVRGRRARLASRASPLIAQTATIQPASAIAATMPEAVPEPVLRLPRRDPGRNRAIRSRRPPISAVI